MLVKTKFLSKKFSQKNVGPLYSWPKKFPFKKVFVKKMLVQQKFGLKTFKAPKIVKKFLSKIKYQHLKNFLTWSAYNRPQKSPNMTGLKVPKNIFWHSYITAKTHFLHIWKVLKMEIFTFWHCQKPNMGKKLMIFCKFT